MKLGIVICTYERANLLAQCQLSILCADKPDNHDIVFVDDHSMSPEVLSLLNTHDYSTMFKDENKGIHDSIERGFNYMFNTCGCDVVMNLDSDAIIKKNGIIKLLELHDKFPDTIVSGFNTLARDVNTHKERHPITESFDNYVTKKSIGGVNMMMNKEIFDTYVLPELHSYNWDWRVCKRMQKDNNLFIVSSPSVVQHLGIKSAIGGIHNLNPDIADDF
jgi:glycosyltransferase involved in cell wall biosynthesis